MKLNGRGDFDIAAEKKLIFGQRSLKLKILNYLKAGSLKGTDVSDSRNVC